MALFQNAVARPFSPVRQGWNATEMTAFRTLPVPVTTTPSPLWMTLVTSGSAVSRVSLTGADGRNWIRC